MKTGREFICVLLVIIKEFNLMKNCLNEISLRGIYFTTGNLFHCREFILLQGIYFTTLNLFGYRAVDARSTLLIV